MTQRPERPTALVTGASRGIGRAIAIALAPAHDLIITARDVEALAQTEARCTSAGARSVRSLPCDMTAAEDRARMCEVLVEAPALVLVNNAGVAPSAPVERTSDDAWRRVMDVNVTAPFEFIRAAVPAMKAAKWGRIVNIASTAALQGYRYTAAYCASKHAILGLSRGVALDVARAGITVNAVCPGFTDTDMATRAIDNISAKTGRDAETARAELERLNPQGRLVTPDEVAALVAYLCSDAAASVHGQALALDGGETA